MNTAFVKIWGKLVGAVAWDQKTGIAAFEYDSGFKNTGLDLSPFKMPIDTKRTVFSFPELKQNPQIPFNTFKGLPGLLADVLPDRYGNQLINLYLAQSGRPLDSMNPVEMLCFIGTRGMGALEFEPSTEKETSRSAAIELKSMVELAQRLLSNKASFKTNFINENEKAVSEILKIGTSAGGARPKAIIAYNEKTGEVRSGQTNVPKGFQHWLIKLDGVSGIQVGASSGYGRVEMAYYNMAIACGINMMPSKLLQENGRAHFMTKRFDREEDNTKHHIQTFCALKHFDFNEVNSFSYEQLFQTMRELNLNYADAEQMYRRMVFNVLSRNCDDHTKNFSFRLKQDSKWELSPGYDICHAYQPQHQWVSQHALSINGKRKDFTKADLLQIGKSISCKNAASIIEEIQGVVNQWNDYAKEQEVVPKLRKEISKTLLVLG
jgi:serine/threonine-protein kinase HipA